VIKKERLSLQQHAIMKYQRELRIITGKEKKRIRRPKTSLIFVNDDMRKAGRRHWRKKGKYRDE
jgi:hypothetical protein